MLLQSMQRVILILLVAGISLGVKAQPVSTVYLPGGLNTLYIDGATALRLFPEQTYESVHITLGAHGRLTHIPASLARNGVFYLPEGGYSYRFDPLTARLEIRHLMHNTLLLALPLNSEGETPVLVQGRERYRFRVDATSLDISKHVAAIPAVKANQTQQPALWYVGSETRQLHLHGPSDLRAHPNTDYSQGLHIHLQTPQAKLVHISAALARQAHFTLPFGVSYQYAFDEAYALVDVLNAQGEKILRLPVDREGKTTWVQIGAQGEPKRLQAYYDETLERIMIAEDSQPVGSVRLSIGTNYPIQANSRLVSLGTSPASIEIYHELDTDMRYVVLLSGEAELFW